MKLRMKDEAFRLINNNHASFLIIVIGVIVSLSSSCASIHATNQPNFEGLVRQSTFIFKGTVIKLQSATMPTVPISERTVVVKVDGILQTPTLLESHIMGKQVTVEVRDHRALKEGQQMIFFATGWLLGESIAMQEIGRLPIEKWNGLRNKIIAKHQMIANQQLQKRIESADIVVVGKVLQRKIADKQGETRPLTEHDPAWEEATIQVESVLKGGVVQENVVFRFSGSMDVAWVNAPKFNAGQEGIWILHKAPKTDVYTVIDPLDFQTKDHLGIVKALMNLAK